jgi:hypothetical protein
MICRGNGRWRTGFSRIAHPLTATRPPERPRCKRSQGAGIENEAERLLTLCTMSFIDDFGGLGIRFAFRPSRFYLPAMSTLSSRTPQPASSNPACASVTEQSHQWPFLPDWASHPGLMS